MSAVESKARECDVLIIGAGMAGGMLTRQLKIQQPDLKIINIDKKETFDYHIGESTVEVWTSYAYNVCKLGPYLHSKQIVKHGLRFFWDNKEKSLPLHEMSEHGRLSYPHSLYSHQLDRSTLDRDLAVMNREAGCEVLLGVKVEGVDGITIDGERGHTVQTSAGPIKCKYLVDAAGRGSLVTRKLDLMVDEPRHTSGSYWGRFKDCNILDDLGPDEWRDRVRGTLRWLSTNHFMYPGYWFWHIPVTERIISIGVEFHNKQSPMKMKNANDLVAFMKQHRCLNDILGDKFEVVDFMGFTETVRRAKQWFSEDRWFLTGMSGFVIDAFLSTTGSSTTFQNLLIGEMIKTDRSGDSARFKTQVKHFNIDARLKFEGYLKTITYYRDQGSYETSMGYRVANASSYFNVGVPEAVEKGKTMIDTANKHHDHGSCECSLEAALDKFENKSLPAAIRRLTDEWWEFTQAEKIDYYRKNSGGYHDTAARRAIEAKWLSPRDPAAELRENLITYEALYRYYVRNMAEHHKVKWDEAAFQDFFIANWNAGQTLAAGLTALRAGTGAKPKRPEVEWIPSGPASDAAERVYDMDEPMAADASKVAELSGGAGG